MIEVDEEVKLAYEKSTMQVDRIILDGQPYRISNVQYSDDVYEEGNIIGTAIARSLEFEIENIVDLERKEFEYQTGVYVGEEIRWISLGNFITQDVEPNNTTNIAKITAMDYMLKSNVEYISQLDYSSNKVTMLDVMEEACSQSGLELATKDFANSNFIVDSNQFAEGTLNRQVFQAIAQMSGTFVKIRSDNKVHLDVPRRKGLLVKEVHVMPVAELNALPVERLTDSTKKDFNPNDYEELILKRNTHPINLVSLGLSDMEGESTVKRDERSILEDGENSLIINDNPFAYTQEKREQLITALFDAVKGFEYTSYEISGQAKPYLETGDEIAVIDKEGNVCLSSLFRFNYKSPNGLESTMEAPSIIKATVNYQNVPSALDVAQKAERRIDKLNGRIEDIVEQQTETSEKLTKHEQDIDGIRDTVREAKQEAIDSANSATDSKLAEYTTTVQSLIDQKADDILMSVEGNYATKTELGETKTNLEASLELKLNTEDLISEINASADVIRLKAGRLIIESGNFQLDKNGNVTMINANVSGKITSNEGEIGGWKINSEGLTNEEVFIKNDGASTIYTVADLIIIREYIKGTETFELSEAMIQHYDLNGDGAITPADYVKLQNLIGITMT